MDEVVVENNYLSSTDKSLQTEGYCINPVTDLVPLCPNCHAMIHRGNEARPLPVDDLRKMLRN